jgi:hypothetical protein
MENFELDESVVENRSKPGNFTVQVDESVIEYSQKSLAPSAKNPLHLNSAVLIPSAPENVVVARNYAEETFAFNREEFLSQGRSEEDVVSNIALHKFSELCVSDYLNSKGIPSSVDFKIYKLDQRWEPDFTTVTTQKGFTFHVKSVDVPTSLRTLGPAYLISNFDRVNEHLPRHYVLGCLVSSDWKEVSLVFCLSTLDVRNHLRSPIKYIPRRRCLYHVTARELPHDDRWGCLRNLVKSEIKNVEITDDGGLSCAD